jgi:hypothetical protein
MPQSVSRFSRQDEILNISQSYRPPRAVTIENIENIIIIIMIIYIYIYNNNNRK